MTRYRALAVVVLFTLSACAVTPQPIQTSPLPTQPSLPQSPVATPGPIVVVPTPAANSGVVTGVILVGKGQDAKPDVYSIVYLAATIKGSDGKDLVAGLDRTRSPRAFVDSQGRFAFGNVPPGNYGLVLDVMMNSYLLNKPDTGDSMVVTASAGKTTDLGTLRYESLPSLRGQQ